MLIGTKKRPVYIIEEAMWLSDKCKIRFAQISENGLWVYFYEDSETPVFSFPAVYVDAMRKLWMTVEE